MENLLDPLLVLNVWYSAIILAQSVDWLQHFQLGVGRGWFHVSGGRVSNSYTYVNRHFHQSHPCPLTTMVQMQKLKDFHFMIWDTWLQIPDNMFVLIKFLAPMNMPYVYMICHNRRRVSTFSLSYFYWKPTILISSSFCKLKNIFCFQAISD